MLQVQISAAAPYRGVLVEHGGFVGLLLFCLIMLRFSPMMTLTMTGIMSLAFGIDAWEFGFDLRSYEDRSTLATLFLIVIASLGLIWNQWQTRGARQRYALTAADMSGPLVTLATACVSIAFVWDSADVIRDIVTRPDFLTVSSQIRLGPLMFLLMLLTLKRIPVITIALSAIFALAITIAFAMGPDQTMDGDSLRMLGYLILLFITFVALFVHIRRVRRSRDIDNAHEQTAETFS